MGLADVRLILPLSFGIGFPSSLFLPTIASTLGILFYFIHKYSSISSNYSSIKKYEKDTKMPFGLFLALAFLILRVI